MTTHHLTERTAVAASARRRRCRTRLLRALVALPLLAALLVVADPVTPRASAAYSGANGLIAYTAWVDGRWEVMGVEPDGTGLVQLTSGGGEEPTFSASGSELAFSTSDGIRVVDLDAGGGTTVPNTFSADVQPTLSPAGQSVAFVRAIGAQLVVFVVGVDGTGLRRLTPHINGHDKDPDFSVHGDEVALARSIGAGGDDIHVVRTDGTGSRRVTDHPADDYQPDFHPTSNRIAFVSDRDGDADIYSVNTDGTDLRRLTDGPAHDTHPVFSPSGHKVAFLRTVGDDVGLYVTDVQGREPTRIPLTTTPNSVDTIDWQSRDFRPPVAVDDPFQFTRPDTDLVVPAPGVLWNDDPGEGCGLAVDLDAELVSRPSNGTVALAADGGYTYRPAAGFTGTDTFTYRARCELRGTWSDVATVTVTVREPPVAHDDGYDSVQGTTLEVPPPGLLLNDEAPGDCDLRVRFGEDPERGSVHSGRFLDGRFTYTPEAGFVGTDVFTYYAVCAVTTVASSEAEVTIRVTRANEPPVTASDAYSTPRNAPLVVAAPGVLGNDSDPDGDPMRAVLVTEPEAGVVMLADDGSFTYHPDDGFAGVDTFGYLARDTQGAASRPTTVTIDVLPTPTTTTLSSSINPATIGEEVVLTATVTAGTEDPTGVVEFVIDDTTHAGCAEVAVVATRATCTTSSLSPGTHQVVARYDGARDGFAASVAELAQVIERADSTTELSSSTNPSLVGEEVAFTATVDSASPSVAPTGAIAFHANGSSLPGCEAVPLHDGEATCTTSALASGAQVVTAAYSGDANLEPSSATLTQEVDRAATTLTTEPMILGLLPLRLLEGPFAVLMSDRGPVTGRFVTFTAGGDPLCTATTDEDGSAGCAPTLAMALRALLSGGYQAAYAGNETMLPSSAPGALVTIW